MKKLLALILVLIMVLSLAACGGDKGDAVAGGNTEPSNNTTGTSNTTENTSQDTTGDTSENTGGETTENTPNNSAPENNSENDSGSNSGNTSGNASNDTNNKPSTNTTPSQTQKPTDIKTPAPQLTESEITSKLRESVVKVICYDYDGTTETSQGSGFFIDDNGTFITNAHVVEDCFYIKIKTHLGITRDVDVMYKYNGTVSDYAICRAKNCFSSTPVEFATSANVGDTVYALGYPNDAFIMSTTSGKITNANAVDGTKHYYANTAWIDHGSSGGILADSNGRVLGMTTGVFADGEYAALKYQDFKFDAEGIHIGTKEPLEYFHTVDEIQLYSFNMGDYFDVIIDAAATSDTYVNYWVTLKLKDQYQNAKILLDSTSISITLKIETEYKYTEIKSYGTSNQTKSDTTRLNFYFFNENALFAGDSQSASSSIFLSSFTEYYDMKISYEADFSGGFGTLVIYDK